MGKKLQREAAIKHLDFLRLSSATLETCPPEDVGTKAGIVRQAMAQVETMQLLRHSQDIEKRRHNLCKMAERILMNRSA